MSGPAVDLDRAARRARARASCCRSIHHRDQARLYAKQVSDGEGELQLSPEEAEAVRHRARRRLTCASATSGPAGTFTEAGGAQRGSTASSSPFADGPRRRRGRRRRRRSTAALVPIENSLEGAVNATLDALARRRPGVAIVGESVLAVRHCLIAREAARARRDRGRASRTRRRSPSARASCASSCPHAAARRRQLDRRGGARASPTPTRPSAAHRPARARPTLHGGVVLREGIEDDPDNATRFVWLARGRRRAVAAPAPGAVARRRSLFAGAGDARPAGSCAACRSSPSAA